MTLEQIRIFLAVAEREHLTRAADAVGRTQAAVSAAIKALETRHDVVLFDRSARGMALTAAGRAFLPVARALLAQSEAGEKALADLAGARRGALLLAASQTIGNYWLPERLARFSRAHPGVELRLTIGNTEQAVAAVEGGRAEIGFVEGALDNPALLARKLAQDELIFVASASLTPPDPDGLVAWMAGQSWIMREKGSGTRALAEAAMRKIGLGPECAAALILPSNESINRALAEGAALACVSRLAAAEPLGAARLRRLRLPATRRVFTLIRHRERYFSRLAQALVDFMEKEPGDIGA